jgi:hypothetical protein
MLSKQDGQIAFSQRFLNQLVTQSEKEFSRVGIDQIRDVLRDILIGASLLSKDRAVRVFESDMVDFIDGITLPIVDLIFSITQKAKIFETRSDRTCIPHAEFFFDLLESLSRLESVKEIEPKFPEACYNVVLSRFLAHDTPNSKYSYFVATFVLFILTHFGYRSGIVDQVRSWLTGTRRKRLPRKRYRKERPG